MSEYPSPFSGGVERVTYNLSRIFRERGHRVYILSLLPPQGKMCELIEDVYVLPAVGRRKFVEEFFRIRGIDVVINQSHHTLVSVLLNEAKKKCNLVTVSVLHTNPLHSIKAIRDEFDLYLRGNLIRKATLLPIAFLRAAIRYYIRQSSLRKSYRNQYSSSDAVVLLSAKYKPDYIKISGIKDGSRLFSISNPVKRSQGNLIPSDKEKIVLFVGRMQHEAKRPDRMVRIWRKAVRYCPDWRLYMIGDGPEKMRLERYCNEQQIPNVVFTGNTDPTPHYSRASIVCLTSTCEGFPMVLIEAQNLGCIPVAYSSYDALFDIVEDGTSGVLVPAFHENAYVKRLVKLMRDSELRKKMAESAKEKCLKFDIQRIADEWENLFKKLTI